MRKVSEQEARELIATIGQARSYIQHNLWTEVEASLYRLHYVENKLREMLGEQPIPRTCYHQCDIHQPVKEGLKKEDVARFYLETMPVEAKVALELDPNLVYGDKRVEEKAREQIKESRAEQWLKADLSLREDPKPVS